MFPCAKERAVKPLPARVTWFADTPPAKSRSTVLAVVTAPLFSVAPVPVAAAVTSTGAVGLTPLYSWA